MALPHLVDQQPGRTVVVRHQHVDVAVVVDVAERRPAADLGQGERGAGPAGEVLEAPSPEVAEQLVALMQRERIAGSRQTLDDLYVAVDHQQIQPAVVVEVGPCRAESRVRHAGRTEADHGAAVLEEPAARIRVQGVGLRSDVGHEEVVVAVGVEVAQIDPHARLAAPRAVHGHAVQQGAVGEGPVLLVDPQLVGLAVVGHVDVEPTVAAEIGGQDAEGRPVLAPRAGAGRHVLERAVPAVAIQAVGRRRVALRRTVVPLAGQRQATLLVLGIVVDVVADVQVQPAVPIDIRERRRHPPARVVHAGPPRDVAERPVPVAAKQLIGAQPRAVQIDPPVVVEVSGRHSHAVGAHVEAATLGDVGEPQGPRAVRVNLQIVAVETIGERQRHVRGGRHQRIVQRLAFSQHLALNEVGVEVAVVVHVEQRGPRRHDLAEVERAGHAVEVDEVDARLPGPVGEPDLVGSAVRRRGCVFHRSRCREIAFPNPGVRRTATRPAGETRQKQRRDAAMRPRV